MLLHCPAVASTDALSLFFLLPYLQAFAEEVSALESEVTGVMDSRNKLLQSESLNINHVDELVKDVHEIEDRYEDLKNRINDALR